jgi:hypothetical protein
MVAGAAAAALTFALAGASLADQPVEVEYKGTNSQGVATEAGNSQTIHNGVAARERAQGSALGGGSGGAAAVAATPELGSLALFGSGTLLVAGYAWYQRRTQARLT